MDAPLPAAAPGALQFDTAEPVAGVAAPEAKRCQACQSTIGDAYHLLNARVICGGCRAQIEAARNNGGAGRLGRALLYGTGAAVAGGAVYYAVVAATDTQFALVAIGVGYAVGRAVRKATGGWGGRGYQMLAVLLTYLAIAGSFVPLVLNAGQQDGHAGSLLGAIIGSLLLPMLVVTDSPIITLIIAFGLWQAWKQTRGAKIELSGPFFLQQSEPHPVLASAPAGD